MKQGYARSGEQPRKKCFCGWLKAEEQSRYVPEWKDDDPNVTHLVVEPPVAKVEILMKEVREISKSKSLDRNRMLKFKEVLVDCHLRLFGGKFTYSK